MGFNKILIWPWQKFAEPTKIERWAVVNFSARCDARGLIKDLIRCADSKGIVCSLVLKHCVYYIYVDSPSKEDGPLFFINIIFCSEKNDKYIIPTKFHQKKSISKWMF